MKDKHVLFNPLRIISPKLDSEAARLEDLHQQSVSETFTLEEGLIISLSKIIEMIRLIREAYAGTCDQKDLIGWDKLALEVDQQQKLILTNLTCSTTIPARECKTFILFPDHLGRVGNYLERIGNCWQIKCTDDLNFSDMANEEIEQTFKLMMDMMINFRDTLIAPNRFLLEHVVAQSKHLDEICQDWQLAHVERLLNGTCAPRASSVYLDVLESAQSLSRHVKDMAEKMLGFVELSQKEN